MGNTYLFELIMILDSLLHVILSAKEKVFYKGLKMKMVKDVIYMDSWKSIRWQEIFILHLGKAFSNQVSMYTIC